MVRAFFTVLFLVLSAGRLAGSPDTLCVLDPAQMPASWLPSEDVKKGLNPAPWSKSEAKDAKYAIKTGLDEMISYFQQKPSAIKNIGADSIEALLQVTYSSANEPEFDTKVRDAARDILTTLIKPYLKLSPASVKCSDFERVLPLAIFAHRLYPANDTRTEIVTKRTNAAYRSCDSLEDAMGNDFEKILANKQARPKVLLELYIWALWFIEAELFPDIELPAETQEFAPRLWKYFQNYQLAEPDEFKDDHFDEGFIAIADLAPHIAHIVTGTHRFPLYVEDYPGLYHWHRENFYSVLEVGELDLFASVVDTLRQYGCTAENDIQVRDGSRFLLKIFHKGKDRWMAYRQEGETDANIDDYGLIHYPWTSVLGVRVRKLEQPRPGTIGGIVRRWLPPPP